MPAKPKPERKEKSVLDRIEASKFCKKHQCPKWECLKQHRKPVERKARPILSKTPIRVKKRSERRVFPKTERTLLERQLDAVCSLIVRIRQPKCVTCDTRRNLECSHFIGRAESLYLRWDVDDNLNSQCKLCNNAHNDDKTAYEEYLLRTRGLQVVESLKAHRGKMYKWTVPELRDLLKKRKRQLDELTKSNDSKA